MTQIPSLIDKNGQQIRLDRQLASGGEGRVFAILNNSARVAKIYHEPPSILTVDKLTSMVRLAKPQLLALTAWPMELLYYARTRQLAGFVMPRLTDCQPIQHLYNPVQRLRCFPRAAWDFQVRAAVNLAAAFDEVHKCGCLVGDVNQSNVQVSTKALVRLIDCDSFQVQLNGNTFLCEVGVPHYIPPELQGKSLRGLVRTENHDRFGLAVLIYQLLFVGRHPYAGVYRGRGDPSFEQLIAEFRFAQGPEAHTWEMTPPPHTPTFADIPHNLRSLFRRAFERGSETGTRPRPAEWIDVLKHLEQSLVECAADPGHKHWRGVHACVWCRLAGHGGPEYYFGVAEDVGTFAVDDAKLNEVLRRLNACGPIDFPYDRRRFMRPQLPDPEPLLDGLKDYRSTTLILSVAVGLCVLALPFGIIHGAICVGGFIGVLIFGIWLAVHILLSPWRREFRRRRVAYNYALRDLDEIEEEWSRTVMRYHRVHCESSRLVNELISDCRGLASRYQVESKRLAANAEAMALIRHLRLHLISDADIDNIGPIRKQVLASNNVFTANDIDECRIRGIRGFGDELTRKLLAWKEKVLRQFRFDSATAISPAEQRALTMMFRNKQRQMLVKADHELAQLEKLAPRCQAELRGLIPAIQQAISVYEQAEADLYVLHE